MSRSLMRAAKELSSLLQEQGCFVDSAGATGAQPVPASTRASFDDEIVGFYGLSVRGVGVAASPVDGAEKLSGVHIYVTRGSQRDLKALPGELNNIPVHAHRLGPVYVKPRASGVTTNRGHVFEHGGRIACGSSCAPATTSYSGTIGAIVADGDGNRYALSNNHVFGDCNHMPVDQPILSPSNADARPSIRAPEEICRHSKIVELRSGTPALVTRCKEDVAIARLTRPDVMSSWQGDDADGFDTPTSVAEPQPGMSVKKFGRTTGLSQGVIESVQVDFTLPYDSDNFAAVVWFEGVWAIRSADRHPFALPGDSGSLVVSEDGENAVGLLFAATNRGDYGFVVPMSQVLSRFGGMTLISGHGV